MKPNMNFAPSKEGITRLTAADFSCRVFLFYQIRNNEKADVDNKDDNDNHDDDDDDDDDNHDDDDTVEEEADNDV